MIAAESWNRLVEQVKRARARRGVRCDTKEHPGGTVVSGEASSQWQHPWFIRTRWKWNDDGTGEWRAVVRPGFVNGRDAYITTPVANAESALSTGGSLSREVALTDEPTPHLVLRGWRNPLVPDRLQASVSGQIIAATAEGYPKFFSSLGVKPPAKGGDATKAGALEGELDPQRTREIRAVDIVLSKARVATRLQVDPQNPLLGPQTQTISTVFSTDALRATGGRAKLRVVPKHEPPPAPQSLAMMYGTLLNAGDSGYDELKLATVWIVSPPGVSSDAEPDANWTPYPQHFVFWNLQHASRLIPPRIPSPPLRLQTGLAGGIGDRINDALLSFVNDRNAEAEAFFNQADARGLFWNT